jgi:para-nitrobenzyl esterase
MKAPTVEIATGKIRGTTDKGIHAFKGIPYGGPTDSENRFMPPTPPAPWTGTRDTTRYGQACWQPADVTPASFHLLGGVGIGQMGEDCLMLNVWTPGLNDGAKRPVMVWLHGGGFFSGSGDHIPYYEGANLARTGDVVVVSVNHRLGVFGYLYLEELCGEKYTGSGNAGMLDIVQALKWVRDNITVLGGDPKNVTIFGESGGGAKVATLQAMPAAKGLFHRAVSQSGPGMRARAASEEANQTTREFLGVFGLKPEQVGALHKMRADMIYSAWMGIKPASGMPMGQFAPVVDGKALPQHPFDPVAAPTGAKVPLMIGTNKDEMTFMMMRDPRFGKYTEAMLRDAVIERTRDKTGFVVPVEKVDGLIAAYKKARPKATPTDILVGIATDRMRMGAIRVAERKAAANAAPVYMYLFTWGSPFMGGILKCPHTMEIPFVFNNVEPTVGIIGNSPERIPLAANVSGAWLAFARSGNPNHKGLPKWPTYDKEKRATMIFNTECKVENDPRGEERKAWEEIR